jgi:hypothetical protein
MIWLKVWLACSLELKQLKLSELNTKCSVSTAPFSIEGNLGDRILSNATLRLLIKRSTLSSKVPSTRTLVTRYLAKRNELKSLTGVEFLKIFLIQPAFQFWACQVLPTNSFAMNEQNVITFYMYFRNLVCCIWISSLYPIQGVKERALDSVWRPWEDHCADIQIIQSRQKIARIFLNHTSANFFTNRCLVLDLKYLQFIS